MARTGNRGDEPTRETSERPLLWWRVPERPGVGKAMLRNVLVWLVSIIVLLIVADVIR